MSSTGRAALVVAVALALLTGCGGDVDLGTPDVSGTVARDGARGTLVDASDDYYEGMDLLLDEADLVDEDGGDLVPQDVLDGAQVEVWTSDACAESSPVQCGIERVRVVGTSG